MNARVVVSVLSLCACAFAATGKCNESSISEMNRQGQKRITSWASGDYVLQALFTVTGDPSCSIVDTVGAMRVLAFKFAVAEVNRAVMPPFSLGFQIDDDCRRLPVAMARGIDMVSSHRSSSVCREGGYLMCNGASNVTQMRPAVAVMGTAMSFTTIPLASLLGIYSIPQVSFSASSPLLSKKDQYRSFFRTMPSDRLQIQVMLDVVKSFQWNYIFAVGADDDYGKLGITELKQHSRAYNVCVSRDEYIPYQSPQTKEKVRQVVDMIEADGKAKIVILFCYPAGMGDLLLQEAARRRIERVWLTSEAWYKIAEGMQAPVSQKQGILSVGYPLESLPKFHQYVRQVLANGAWCDVWLRTYIKTRYDCDVFGSSGDKLLGSCTPAKDFCLNALCELNSTEVAQDLLDNAPGNLGKLIDAVQSVAWGINRVIRSQCNASLCEAAPRVAPDVLTKEMFSVSFVNDRNWPIAFNEDGDPKFVSYTVQNLQYVNGTFRYVRVGNWEHHLPEGRRLLLQKDLIQWPTWTLGLPQSVCTEECLPGEFVVGKTGCCWGCADCPEQHVSNASMAEKCEPCRPGYHTLNRITCLRTPILYLTPGDAAGLAILVMSGVGLLLTAFTAGALYRLRGVFQVEQCSPHLLIFSMTLITVTFCYGPLHMLEPTDVLCQCRDSFFFVLFMVYGALLMVKTNFMTGLLETYVKSSLKRNVFASQFLFVIALAAIEIAAVVAWLRVSPFGVEYVTLPEAYEKWKQCKVTFNVARLVVTFIPCVLLIVATFCAFRERGISHPFYEPKFLSFTCIAMCIITVAFLPTFKYVVGIYKSIVMAFTVDVCGLTYLACLILPKVYVAVVYQRNLVARAQGETGHRRYNSPPVRSEPLIDGKASEELSDYCSSVTDSSASQRKRQVNEGGGYVRPPVVDSKPEVSCVGTNNSSFESTECLSSSPGSGHARM